MRYLDDEGRAKFEAALTDALAHSKATIERVAEMERLITAACLKKESWAIVVRTEAQRDGYNRMLKAFDAKEKRALVSYDGRVLNKPRVVGVKAKSSAGKSYVERALIDVMTWDQVEHKLAESAGMRRSYSENAAMYRRLLDLREKAPNSTGPQDAAKSLGIDLDEWLLTEDNAS